MEAYDTFFDLQRASDFPNDVSLFVKALSRHRETRSATLAAPDKCPIPNTGGLKILPAANAFDIVVRKAANLNRHLVVITDLLMPAAALIDQLIAEFEYDPMFGTTQPRFVEARTDRIWALPGHEEIAGPEVTLSRSVLSLLPDRTITTELLSAFLVIRREVVRQMARQHFTIQSTAGSLRLLLCQARRRGYRNVIVNRALEPSELPHCRVYPRPAPEEMRQLAKISPDISQAYESSSNLSQGRLEALMARVHAPSTADRHRMLLDCRGMRARHDGTAHSILGFLTGFNMLSGDWQFDVLALPEAIEFHSIADRYPKLQIVAGAPCGTYAAGILLNQPWSLSTVAQLHRHAFLVAFTMLDTIAWDILYVCDDRLDALWRFVGTFADALFYDSQFTRDRFRIRFPVGAQVAEMVTYLSFARDEQIELGVIGEPVGDTIVVIGNDYDHKDMRHTLTVLMTAFPFNRIVAVGIEGIAGDNVVCMPSGQIDHTVLHHVMATARIIVFPSFYEGFGMPVVQGLAYGRPVVVRRSPLWNEIAGELQLPGPLIEFEDDTSLLEAIGKTLAGGPVDSLDQGTQLRNGRSPLRWQDCAQRTVDLIEKLLPITDCRKWQRREDSLRAIRLLRT